MIYTQTPQGEIDIFSTVENTPQDANSLQKPLSRLNYIICFTARSGSTMLCSLLKETGLLGMPDEFVNPRGVMQCHLKNYPASDVFEYFDLLRRNTSSSNGIFGMKTSLQDFKPLLDQGIVGKLFNPVRFIYLTRNDIVLQAISLHIARQSKIWHIPYGESVERNVEYDENEILKYIDSLTLERLQWERFFTLYTIDPLRINYEKTVENNKETIQEILDFMGEAVGVKIDIQPPATAQLSGEREQEWAQRIRAKFIL